MALGSGIPAPPTTSPACGPQFPCPSGQLCSLYKEMPPGLFASETQEHVFILSVFAPRLAKLPTRSTQSMSGIAVAPGTSVTSLTRGQLTLSPESVFLLGLSFHLQTRPPLPDSTDWLHLQTDFS